MKNAVLALALAASACARVATLDAASNDAQSLAAAESAFAAQAVREGTRGAFLHWLAPQALLFRPGPVNGHEVWQARPATSPNVLDWRPAFVVVSASGDFGLSTGPWKITNRTDATQAPLHGQFVSVWKRSSTGPWRNYVDLGISNPGPALWDAPLDARQLAAGQPVAGTLAQAEAEFARIARSSGNRAAYAALASPALRLYRDEQTPPVGREASLAAPGASGPATAWTADTLEAARSDDLGYAIGRFADAKAPATVLGHYVRVWRREQGAWKVLLDVTSDVPPPKA